MLRRPPAHRDKTAMNGAQLHMAHGDSSGLMTGAQLHMAHGDSSGLVNGAPAHNFAHSPASDRFPRSLQIALRTISEEEVNRDTDQNDDDPWYGCRRAICK